MIKELKYFFYLLTIFLFVFFCVKYYFSDDHIKKSYRSKFIRNFIKKYSISLGKLRSRFINKPLGIVNMIESLNKKEQDRTPISYDLKNSLVNKFSKTDIALKEIINNY